MVFLLVANIDGPLKVVWINVLCGCDEDRACLEDSLSSADDTSPVTRMIFVIYC